MESHQINLRSSHNFETFAFCSIIYFQEVSAYFYLKEAINESLRGKRNPKQSNV